MKRACFIFFHTIIYYTTMFKAIYNELGIRNPTQKDKSQVEALLQPPKKAKGSNAPTFHNEVPNAIHQADLLFLPNDNGYKYCLTVIDVATRKGDAQPLKSKRPTDLIKAFDIIYRRSYLSKPKVIQVDDGSEFKGAMTTYFQSNNIGVRRGLPGRSKQQALAEYLNYIIGKALLARQAAQELRTHEVSREWVEFLPDIVRVYNKHTKPSTPINHDAAPTCKDDSCKLLSEGDKVLVALDHPKDVAGKRQTGKFRAGDLRYETEPRTITTVILRPGQPPMYKVSGRDNVAYTKEELMPYKQRAQATDKAMKKWIVEKIVRRVPNKKPLHYVVKWKGYKDTTIEPAAILKEDIPEMVKAFEQRKK